MIEALCFDMDGVLFDTERLSGLWLAEAAGLAENEVAPEQWRALAGTNMDDTCTLLETWFPGRIDRARIIRDWPRVTLEWMAQNGLPFKPYAQEVLPRLKARGYKLSLCTSNEPEVAHAYLRMAGWEKLFDFIVTSDMVAKGKPAPDIFLHAARLMGVAPKRCAGIEDSPHGLRAIRDAGMLSVMIPDLVPYAPALSPLVDACLSNLRELEQFLLRVNEKE